MAGCREDAVHRDAAPLKPPYSLGPDTPPAGASTEPCPLETPPPIKDLIFGSVYKRSDPTRSETDMDAKAHYRTQTESINAYEKKLVEMSNRYLKSNKKDRQAAVCALDWLYDWAAGQAYLGQANVQGGFVRQWGLATLSSAYLQVRDAPFYDADDKQKIEDWLAALARAVKEPYGDFSAPDYRQNNHLYWAAWAITITGVAINDRAFYEWGVNKVKYVLHTQPRTDGLLPHEVLRGQKALQYHVFALAPLIMVCETALRNGDDLYALNDNALHKIVARTFTSIAETAYMEDAAGSPQLPAMDMATLHFSWLEVYNARFPRAEISDFLNDIRPVFSQRTGGNMTFLYTAR